MISWKIQNVSISWSKNWPPVLMSWNLIFWPWVGISSTFKYHDHTIWLVMLAFTVIIGGRTNFWKNGFQKNDLSRLRRLAKFAQIKKSFFGKSKNLECSAANNIVKQTQTCRKNESCQFTITIQYKLVFCVHVNPVSALSFAACHSNKMGSHHRFCSTPICIGWAEYQYYFYNLT